MWICAKAAANRPLALSLPIDKWPTPYRCGKDRWEALAVRFVTTEPAHDNIQHNNEAIIVDCRIPPGSRDTVTFVNAALPEGSFFSL
jgi:hypothetical protein